MQINADLSKSAFVNPEGLEWRPSPLPGVERQMLERDGDEVAVCATLVRYAPGSKFDAHTHAKGEEFFVIDGVFSDEHGDFPEGSYIRNPPGTSHAPFCKDGCTIFVRLRQFLDTDTTPVKVNTTSASGFVPFGEGDRAQAQQLPLHEHSSERTSVVRLPANVTVDTPKDVMREVYVISGNLTHPSGAAPPRTWFRVPAGADLALSNASADAEARVLYREGRAIAAVP